MATHKELPDKIAKRERRFSKHDKQIQAVFAAAKQLVAIEVPRPRRRIGYVA
jgi:hypothetical protein